ncbi:hypothetical protein ANCCEY_01449 [Ancylostoma ceylanicum]|uniref:Uncharacterized protein n=1 Tax=Ancylostoma ceylanicum TaxID=53326 RepID=A0A0D6MCU3_9BILA|nr:hypothetical protein ANCCEY_01449 [Ancylostoma ceylanicum]
MTMPRPPLGSEVRVDVVVATPTAPALWNLITTEAAPATAAEAITNKRSHASSPAIVLLANPFVACVEVVASKNASIWVWIQKVNSAPDWLRKHFVICGVALTEIPLKLGFFMN